MAISRYGGEEQTGVVRIMQDLTNPIVGENVIVVEDIVDTGLTSAFLRAELARRTPRSVSICTLLDRPARRVVPVDLEFVGREIPDEYVIGFGLDHEGRYRNLELVAVADPEVLRQDPDAYVAAFYGGG
jgi:hypoxanthine phosphoribosyltransferase